MGKLRIYFKPIWYNIMHHKAYAGFCVFGTMLTFVFITILLQVTNVIMGNTPPTDDPERVLYINSYVYDKQGECIGCCRREDVASIMSNVVGYDCYACTHFELGNILVNGQYIDNGAEYVEPNYWNVLQYHFVQGRSWEEEESHQPYAIVNKSFAERYFATDDVLGKEIEFQETTYKILGVVADVSMFSIEGRVSVWLPEHFNEYISTGSRFVETYVLFPEDVSVEIMKRNLKHGFDIWTRMQNWDNVRVREFSTLKEVSINMNGGDLLLMGLGGILFILLIIPLLNIILLSMANNSVQASEIGLRRALGANRFTAFMAILSENLVLILIGTLGGIILVTPVCRYIDGLFFMDSIVGRSMVLPEIDWMIVLLIVLPLSVLFSLVSGGIPAYLNVKRSIVDMLKGGSKC